MLSWYKISLREAFFCYKISLRKLFLIPESGRCSWDAFWMLTCHFADPFRGLVTKHPPFWAGPTGLATFYKFGPTVPPRPAHNMWPWSEKRLVTCTWVSAPTNHASVLLHHPCRFILKLGQGKASCCNGHRSGNPACRAVSNSPRVQGWLISRYLYPLEAAFDIYFLAKIRKYMKISKITIIIVIVLMTIVVIHTPLPSVETNKNSSDDNITKY